MLEGATCGTQRQARCRRRAPRRRGEGFRGEAPWLQFTNSIDAAAGRPVADVARPLAARPHQRHVKRQPASACVITFTFLVLCTRAIAWCTACAKERLASRFGTGFPFRRKNERLAFALRVVD